MDPAADAANKVLEETGKQVQAVIAQLEAIHIQVLHSELKFVVQKDLHRIFRSAVNEYGALGEEERNKQLTKVLKEHMEKITNSPGWSCIVGSSFSVAFAFNDLMHHFMAGSCAVLLFRCV